MTRIIHAIASWCQTVPGFAAINVSWLLWLGGCLAFGWSQTPFLTYLSILAIVIGTAILVAGRTSEKAIQVKLDTLVAAIPAADDAVIGIEKEV